MNLRNEAAVLVSGLVGVVLAVLNFVLGLGDIETVNTAIALSAESLGALGVAVAGGALVRARVFARDTVESNAKRGLATVVSDETAQAVVDESKVRGVAYVERVLRNALKL